MSNKDIETPSFDEFSKSTGRNESEIYRFYDAKKKIIAAGIYTMESVRMTPPNPIVNVKRETGEEFRVFNFATYNYLGYATHPKVIQAAKEALDNYGLGCCNAPLGSGILPVHKLFEQKLVEFFCIPNCAVTLFPSGFAALVGTITAYIREGDCVIADSAAHASIIDGMLLSGGEVMFFKHNDMDNLAAILQEVDDGNRRILVCTEGCFSISGTCGKVREIVRLAKRYGAKVLVDEAHSMLISGPNGRGVCEQEGVLEGVDMIVGTMSKSFSGIGGFLLARQELTNYVSYFARNRMFSCALDPAVMGGMIASLELAGGEDGTKKRQRIRENAMYLRSLLADKVVVTTGNTWIIPVLFGKESIANQLSDFLQKNGLVAPLMVFPAVRKNKGCIRLFVTSEHTREQMCEAADIIFKAAEYFGFLKNGEKC